MSVAAPPMPAARSIAGVGSASPSALGATRAQLNVMAGPLQRHRLSLSVIVKPTGAVCDLDCQYCFFLSKELLYNVPYQLMSEETLETYITEYLIAGGDGEATVLWWSNGPTLRGLSFFRRLIELHETYRCPAQRMAHVLQTNATLIDEQWATFLADNDVLVGILMDGPPVMYDAYRLNRGGRGTHATVLHNWRRLVDVGVCYDILCIVYAANQGRGVEVHRYFCDGLGATHLRFISIVERVKSEQLAAVEIGWRTDSGTWILYR